MIDSAFQVCNKTNCEGKYICLNNTCTPDVYCNKCLNSKHFGKDNAINHLEDIIEIDKFMQQVTSKIRQREQFYNQMIDQCQLIHKDNIQQISMAPNSERSRISKKKIQKDVQEFIESLENEKQQLLNITQYSLQEHENLKKIYFSNEEIEMKKIQDKQNKLQAKIDKIIQSLYIDTELNVLKLEEKTKTLTLQNRKSIFSQQINFSCIIVLALVILYQRSQIEGLRIQHTQQLQELYQQNEFNMDSLQLSIENVSNQHNRMNDEIQIKFQNFTEKVSNFTLEITHQFEELKKQLDLKDEDKSNLYQEAINIQQLIGEIHIKLNLDVLKKFTLIYDNAFTKPFNTIQKQKIEQIIQKTGQDPLICIGGLHDSNLNTFLLAGCDLASEIFQVTTQLDSARKSLNGGIYWYWVENYSFGFSPHMRIKLDKFDRFDLDIDSCQTRFSYKLNDQWTGGGRIGAKENLKQSVDYRMRIYMLLV